MLGLNKQFVAELVQEKQMLLINFQIFPTDTHLEKKWDFGSRWYSSEGCGTHLSP